MVGVLTEALIVRRLWRSHSLWFKRVLKLLLRVVEGEEGECQEVNQLGAKENAFPGCIP